MNKFLLQLGADPTKWQKKGVQNILCNNSTDIQHVIKSNLKQITNKLRRNIVSKVLYRKIVEGVQGRTDADLAAEVALQAEEKLESSPELLQEYISVIDDYDSTLAERMRKQYEGEDACHTQQSLSVCSKVMRGCTSIM